MDLYVQCLSFSIWIHINNLIGWKFKVFSHININPNSPKGPENLALVLLNPYTPCLCKQCRTRLVGFWCGSICTVFVIQFMDTYQQSDWLEIKSGRDILIYTAYQHYIKVHGGVEPGVGWGEGGGSGGGWCFTAPLIYSYTWHAAITKYSEIAVKCMVQYSRPWIVCNCATTKFLG